MKITSTEIYQFSIPMVPFTIATGTMDYAQNVLIRIHTDAGLTGTGECSAFPMIVGETQQTCIAVGKDLAGIIKGHDPLRFLDILEKFDNYIAGNATIKSAFDMALYDIAAQAAGLPLYAYLGGHLRQITTDITIGIDAPEKMAAQALHFKKSKASILKVKVGKEPQADIQRIQAIRAAVGADMKIRLDANQGWNLQDAITALDGMKKQDIEFCEQPLRSYNDLQIKELKAQVQVPIMADESCYHLRDVSTCAEAGFDFINIKLAKSGGIYNALQIADQAAALSIPCMMGGMLESRVALTAMAHLVMAAENIRYYDMDTCLLGQTKDPVCSGVQVEAYRLLLPQPERTGIGVDIDPLFLNKCQSWKV